MVKIAIDAGHGGSGSTPGKRTPDGEYEWNFNNKVVKAAIKYLNEYKDVEILRLDDPTGKTDVPLKTRTDKANKWGADIIISYHHNALAGKWGTHGGTEVFTYIGEWPDAERLAKLTLERLLKAYGLRNRGLKKANFHMLRESKMPAILVEGGFMDSTIDIKKMRDDKVLDAAGKAVAEGAVDYFGLKKKESKPSTDTPKLGTTFRVKKDTDGYYTAADAKAGKNKRTAVKAGVYYVFNTANGMINVTTKNGTPGSWINPADNVVPSKQETKQVHLPASSSSWRVYPTNKAPVKGNEKGFLNPKKFGGLVYDIIGTPQKDVVTIRTAYFGVVNIYVAPSTGAVIK